MRNGKKMLSLHLRLKYEGSDLFCMIHLAVTQNCLTSISLYENHIWCLLYYVFYPFMMMFCGFAYIM